MKFIKKNILIILLLICFKGFSQEYHSINYTVNDGLPSSQVYDIIQDKKGYIWFATDRGLTRFNGYEFKTFDVQDGLTDNSIFRFYPQKDSTIWCKTLNNKLFYINNSGGFTPYKFNHLLFEDKKTYDFSSILLQNDTLYISFRFKNGYLRIDKNGGKKMMYQGEYTHIVIDNYKGQEFNYRASVTPNIKSLFKNNQLIHSERKKEKITSYKTTSIKNTGIIIKNKTIFLIKDNISEKIITETAPSDVGIFDSLHFWVGFKYGGVKIYNLNGVEKYHLLKDKYVTELFLDHERGIWVSTFNSGVYYFNNYTISKYLLNESNNNKIHTLTSTPNKKLIIGYYNGDVYQFFNNKSILISKSHQKHPASVQYYNSINDVIYCNDNNVTKMLGNKILNTSHYVRSFSEEKNSEIAYSTPQNIVIGNKKHPVATRIHDLCVFKNKILLSSNNGIYKYLKNNTIEKYNNHSLYSNRVDDIDSYKDGFVAASLGAGVIFFNDDTVFSIGKKEGLYSNLVTEIIVENDSTFWACTNKGLNRIIIKNKNYKITGISNNDGLISNEVFDVEIINNNVWVATGKGLCLFDKNFLNDKKTHKGNYYTAITSIKVNDNVFNEKRIKNLRYFENRIEISYTGISFKYREKLSYRYKLKNLEDIWNYTNNRSVTYSSLAHGKYTFILQSKGENGIWEDNELQFPIIIHPAFYQTLWFTLLIIISTLILLFLFFKYNILSYNKDIIREILRKLLSFLNRKTNYLIVKENGKEIKIETSDIYYIKSFGNYLEIYTESNKIIIRDKITDFTKKIPDSLEFLRIHRSYIIRIDKIEKKDSNSVYINNTEIPIGISYKEEINEILI